MDLARSDPLDDVFNRAHLGPGRQNNIEPITAQLGFQLIGSAFGNHASSFEH